MIVRIVHGIDRRDPGTAAGPVLPPGVRPGSAEDRARLARAAAKVNGLETLILGWRMPADEGTDPSELAGASVVITVWLDVETMVAAAAHETAFLHDRLGVRVEVERGETYEVMSRTFGSLPTPSAVLRIITLTARPRAEASLFERLRDIQTRLTGHGLIASHVARRVGTTGIEGLVVSVWSDAAAVEGATEGRVDRPAFAPELEPWVESVAIDTYQAMEIAPRLPMASGPPILVIDGSRRIVDLTPAAAAVLGQTQDEAVGTLIEALAGPANTDDPVDRLRPRGDDRSGDETGESAWPLGPGGHVMVRWRLRRDVPVPGRHTLLVHRRQEPEPTAEALDAALSQAFPPDAS
jgi:PAS domain-containing protein